LAITTCVTRDCADGTLQKIKPFNERQQTTAVLENGALVIVSSRKTSLKRLRSRKIIAEKTALRNHRAQLPKGLPPKLQNRENV
jgi:hypothetical protein